MTVRPYFDKDFDEVSSIDLLSHRFHTPDKELKDEIAKGRSWVATIDDQVVGFLVGQYRARLPYVYNVAVHPFYQGREVATDLFTVFHNHFSGFDTTWLQVDVNNSAQTLYFKLGYRVRRVTPGLYGPDTISLDMFRTNKQYKK